MANSACKILKPVLKMDFENALALPLESSLTRKEVNFQNQHSFRGKKSPYGQPHPGIVWVTLFFLLFFRIFH